MLKKSQVSYLYFPLSVICFIFSWAVRMPKSSSWNDEQLLCLISLSCIVYNSYSPRTGFVGLKKFILNLKLCGLRVHDLSLSYWEIWNDGLELLQICSEQNFMSGTFIFENYKIKSSSVMKYTYQSHMHEAYKETTFLHTACIFLSSVKFCDLCEFLFILSWSRITYTTPPYAKTSTLEG